MQRKARFEAEFHAKAAEWEKDMSAYLDSIQVDKISGFDKFKEAICLEVSITRKRAKDALRENRICEDVVDSFSSFAVVKETTKLLKQMKYVLSKTKEKYAKFTLEVENAQRRIEYIGDAIKDVNPRNQRVERELKAALDVYSVLLEKEGSMRFNLLSLSDYYEIKVKTLISRKVLHFQITWKTFFTRHLGCEAFPSKKS
ncbi:hypothetical protein ACJMK2_041943, partial [Sinanodonta woodiana]